MENKVIEKCGEQFTLTTYLGITIVIDSDEYIQAAKICKDTGKEFHAWYKLDSTKELISNYQEDVDIKASFYRTEDHPSDKNPDLIRYRDIKYQEFQGAYIHKCLIRYLCEWCDFKYSRIVDKIINMINEEIKLRNITIEAKLKEMKETLEKLRLTNKELTEKNEELVKENKNLSDKLVKGNDEIKDLKHRSVPKKQSIRYLTILYDEDGYKLYDD